jgi:hypothetical protein
MGRAVRRAKRFYSPQLAPGEEIKAIRNATAAGTGTLVGYGALIGALLGWLYAINADNALLPALVLGAFAGEIGGYLMAHRRARQPSGPGAVHLQLIQTDTRLFTVPRHASVRRQILREYPLDEVTAIIARRYPIGQYRRIDITDAAGATTAMIVEGELDLP